VHCQIIRQIHPIRSIRGDTAETSHLWGEIEDNTGCDDTSMEDGEAEEEGTIDTGDNRNESRDSDTASETEEDKNFSNRSAVESNNERSRISVPGDNFLAMLANSAGKGASLFTSWEPGRQDQFYFSITRILAQQAEEWLDVTTNQLLQEHGIHKCLRVFGSTNEEMPREETKI